jgi:hypothetical protein
MRAVPWILALLLACSDSPTAVSTPVGGRFRYVAYSATGQPLLTGQLDFASPGALTLTGRWAIAWLPGADTTSPVGPQVGTGEFEGSRRDKTLLIQLNPLNADHNVGLQAEPTTHGYAGYWEWTTLTGTRARGRFTATSE